MEKKFYTITINASSQRVWSVLWEDDTYREWTSVFAETSWADTDWQKGSKVLFLDGNGSGMASRIVENIPNTYMSIEHLGIVKDGKEDYESDEVKSWAGGLENYSLQEVNGQTELAVDIDVTPEHEDYFNTTWPKALEKIKQLAE